MTQSFSGDHGLVNEPRELDVDECQVLLACGLVGRVALCTPEGPQIFPVNYAVYENAVVFRTAPYSVLGSLAWNQRLALEIDHVDYERRRGWSVVASGRGEMVEDPDEIAAIRSSWDPSPWAGGERQLFIKLQWTSLTGRQIGHGWAASDEPPVRRRL